MKVIYKLTNKINKKIYIGQTNNFKKRMNSHKSVAYNTNATSYNLPLYCAIRKYGWDNFLKEVVEEINDNESQSFVDERERFFIQYYNSLISQNGYNITVGGQGNARSKQKSFEEKLSLSHILSKKEILDIIEQLKQGIKISNIRQQYYPKISDSFIRNINAGLNFSNPDWEYPLHDYGSDNSVKLTIQEQEQVKNDIKANKTYKEIADKWKISIGLVSMINNGKVWKDDDESYPLCTKGSSKLHNKIWVKKVQKELINTNKTIKQIAKDYNKAYSTIKKINEGYSHKKPNYKYPLTSNRE